MADTQHPAPDAANTIASSLRFGTQASQLAELGSLTAMLAHEINNQTTIAQSHAQLALQHRHPPHTSDQAEAAYQSLDQVLAILRRTTILTESMMRYAQPAPPAESEPQFADVYETHIVAQSFVCPDPSSSTIDYRFTCNTSGAHAQIDPISLEQIFINLYMNAERAIHCQRDNDPDAHETVLVNASLECSTWNTPQLRITVQDSGQGMDDESVANVFKPWVRGKSPDRRQRRGRRGDNQFQKISVGHGLGLAVCEKLVTEAGGSISCESTPGIGTTFTIVIPAYSAGEGTQANHSQAAA